MKQLQGVCIGAGYFSQFHFEAWQRMEGVEITAVCDQQIEKAQKVCDEYGFGEAYSDVEEMLNQQQVDFIDIITPPHTHLDLCLLAIEAGVHIICQKPLAPTYAEAQQISDAVEASPSRMMVHENFRFQPWHREIKQLLNQETIGDKIHSISLRMRMGDGWGKDAYLDRQPYFREMEQLLIYETGIHQIDVFQYLLGNIHSVYAKLKTLNSNIRGEDFAWVHMEFEQGCLGLLDANRYNESTASDPRLTFGKILLEGSKGSIRLYEDGKITVQLLGEPEKEYPYTFQKINFAADCVFATQAHFVNQLRSGEAFETDVKAYLQNLLVQEAIYESNRKGTPQSVQRNLV